MLLISHNFYILLKPDHLLILQFSFLGKTFSSEIVVLFATYHENS